MSILSSIFLKIGYAIAVVRKDKKTEEEFEFIVTNGRELLKPGDKLKRNGEWIQDLKYPEKRSYKLNIGDIIERQLQDGDSKLQFVIFFYFNYSNLFFCLPSCVTQ